MGGGNSGEAKQRHCRNGNKSSHCDTGSKVKFITKYEYLLSNKKATWWGGFPFTTYV
jgi:hypothetical protein